MMTSPTDVPSSVVNDNAHNSTETISRSSVTRVGQVKGGDDTSGGFTGLIPLIAGVAGAVVIGAVVIGVLAWMWAKNQKRKQEKDNDDQMNIITEYVETNLTI